MAENPTVDTSGESSEGRPLEVYEWGGGIVAGLGFFLTPLVTGLPALYCMLKVQEEKPLSALGIGSILLVTVLFWAGFLLGEEFIGLVSSGGTEDVQVTALGLFALLVILAVPVLTFVIVVTLRR